MIKLMLDNLSGKIRIGFDAVFKVLIIIADLDFCVSLSFSFSVFSFAALPVCRQAPTEYRQAPCRQALQRYRHALRSNWAAEVPPVCFAAAANSTAAPGIQNSVP